mmetsp:Transcript_64394/g.151629  ORF Transcript_64394/g.151629 Transcript_64394/m.151629 type:complete len:247 (-) Transcript_64394:207-947(-)
MTQSAAVLESLRNALQELIEWLHADDENVNARVVLQDGIVETWIAICPPKSFKNAQGPQPTRERMVRYSGRDFLTADECVSKVESSGIEVQEIRIHRWRTTGPNCSMMTPDEQPYFSHPPTDKQEQEAGDYTKYRDLHGALYKKIFPVWRPVASGQRPDAPWETAQSSDALVFFVDWLICSVDDVARARFFLSASEAQMEQELDSNLDVYTRDDGGERWLVGEDASVDWRRNIEKFRARWPERLAA